MFGFLNNCIFNFYQVQKDSRLHKLPSFSSIDIQQF